VVRVTASALDGTLIEGAAGSLSLTRRFDLTGVVPARAVAEKMKRTAVTPSNAQTERSSRSAMPAPSVSGVY
jgi:hypothetical protein